MKLIATHPILHQSKQYNIGEEVPANNAEMVEAWITAGTAEWVQDEKERITKAVSMTAETGLSGISTNTEVEDNLVGKIPKTNARKKAR